MFAQHRAEVTSRFICCGLSDAAAINLSARLTIWESHHGTKWVVQRLKDFYGLILGKEVPSIKRKPNGDVYGDFSPVFKLSKKGRKGFRNALRICKIYGIVKAPRVTRSDYVAFQKLVAEDHTPVLLNPIHIPEIWHEIVGRFQPGFNLAYPSGETRAPKSDLKTDFEYNIGPSEHLRTLDNFPNLVLNHYKFFHDIMPVMELSHYFYLSEAQPEDVVGKVVGLTKDRGMKIRFIANPFRTIQMVLSRLKNAVEDLLANLVPSCVFDQESGMMWVVSQLQEGKRISSIDLSNCSDNLPLEFQLEMLYELFPALSEDIEIFGEISRSLWATNENVTIQWKNGQPLGTGPSFSTFTTWHILFVLSLGGRSNEFRVIGDDIVISDPQLAKRYVAAMERLQVPISPSKSFYDSEIAEFAGRTIDSKGIFALYKAKPINLKNDPLGPLRQYGQRGVRLVPQDLWEMLKFVYQLPPPYGSGGFTVRQLREVDSGAFYELYSKSLPRLPCVKIPKLGRKIRPGESSGIPPGVVQDLFRDDDYINHVRSWFTAKVADKSGEWVPLHLSERSESERRKKYGPLFEKKIKKEHINSFSELPIEEVPMLIRDQFKLLENEADVPFKLTNESFPLSFIRKIYRLFERKEQ